MFVKPYAFDLCEASTCKAIAGGKLHIGEIGVYLHNLQRTKPKNDAQTGLTAILNMSAYGGLVPPKPGRVRYARPGAAYRS